MKLRISSTLILGLALLPLNYAQGAETDVLGHVDEVAQSVAEVSGLSLKAPLDTRLLTRSALRDMLKNDAARHSLQPDWPGTKEALIIMGSWPDGYDGPSPYVEAAVLNATGIYSRSRKALFVVYDPPQALGKGPLRLNTSSHELRDDITLAHEIVHALQHMHYPDLFDRDNPVWKHQNDAAFALKAAIEGRAVVVSLQSQLGFMGTLLPPDKYQERILKKARAPGFSPLERLPLLVREGQAYPYAYGYRLAWNEGRDLLRSPPASSEQVLHDERRREQFLVIDLSNYRDQLSQRGCELLFEDTMGELSLSLLLRSYPAGIGPESWEGWDGDRYVTAKCDGQREFAWFTSWDTADDATEFEHAYRQIASMHRARAGLRDEAVTARQDRLVFVLSSGFAKDKNAIASGARTKRVGTRAELAKFFNN